MGSSELVRCLDPEGGSGLLSYSDCLSVGLSLFNMAGCADGRPDNGDFAMGGALNGTITPTIEDCLISPTAESTLLLLDPAEDGLSINLWAAALLPRRASVGRCSSDTIEAAELRLL